MTLGIVLGGGITDEGTLPRDVEKRVLKAIALFQKKIIGKIMVTGGATNPRCCKITEAVLMQKLLISHDIPKNRIFLEKKAKDTIGNAVFSKDIILKKRLGKNIVVITSGYHLRRALSIFRHVFGTDYMIIGKATYTHLLHRFRMMLREWEEKEVEALLIDAIPSGDHKKALTFMYAHLLKYKKRFL
jgi:uncharacterized SAM-binding protein YcdF (DUF218 family)